MSVHAHTFLKLKKSYTTVTVLKQSSGIPWSKSKGLNINGLEMEEIYSTYIKVCFPCSATILYLCTDHPINQTNLKATHFKTNGFPFYDLMSRIMPDRERGVNAFCASEQSRGAASNMPALPGKGKRRAKPTEKIT
jgi:hypothetical protein